MKFANQMRTGHERWQAPVASLRSPVELTACAPTAAGAHKQRAMLQSWGSIADYASAGESSQAGCTSWMLRSARHTALLHLKPDPKAICHTRSPRRTDFLLSMFDSTYLQQAASITCSFPKYCGRVKHIKLHIDLLSNGRTTEHGSLPDGGGGHVAPAVQRILGRLDIGWSQRQLLLCV